MNRLRNMKLPNWDKYVDVDLVSEIFDAWDEGEVNMGSTDVSDVSWNTPTMEFSTATFVLGAPGHAWQAVACSGTSIGHKSLIFAAKTITGSALDLLTKPGLVEKARDELSERLQGRTYMCPIPDDIAPPLQAAREAAERLGRKG